MFPFCRGKKEKLYEKYLSEISGISFTSREIDIISCIAVYNRGEKKIASLLSIAPRTVGVHTHNVMKKLGNNSREYILDFVENAGKLGYIKELYLHIRLQSLFHGTLSKIKNTIIKKEYVVKLDCAQLSADEEKELSLLNDCLASANIKLLKNTGSNHFSNTVKIINDSSAIGDVDSNIILVCLDGSLNTEGVRYEYINIISSEPYCFLVIDIIQRVFKSSDLDKCLKQYKKERQAIIDSYNLDFSTIEKIDVAGKGIPKIIYILIILPLIIAGILYTSLNSSPEKNNNPVRIDLATPHKSVTLSRVAMLKQIENNLSNNYSLSKAVLVGIGGSGKTTLARKYAKQSGAEVIWEHKAGSVESLSASAGQLAYSLCNTPSDRQELRVIMQNSNGHEKNTAILAFIASRIRNYNSWLIIFDNVRNFKEVKHFFPNNGKMWKNGQIIITTRDENIEDDDYFSSSEVIKVGLLTKDEKLKLFNQILRRIYPKESSDFLKKTLFLDAIPPYPLDISIAAHYIGSENISYDQYLENIDIFSAKSDLMQRSILRDISDYHQTRVGIVVSSIQAVIETNPEFEDLLLFCALVGNKDIPISLLSEYKNDILAESFILTLKEFSLITKEDFNLLVGDRTFSIHQSTHDIILKYIKKPFNLHKNKQKIPSIINVIKRKMATTIEQHSVVNAEWLSEHAATAMLHQDLMNDDVLVELMISLGEYYVRIENYDNADKVLKNALLHATPLHNEVNIAKIFRSLGELNLRIGRFKEAKKLLERSVKIYKKNYGDDHNETAWALGSLGIIYRNLGDYAKARIVLENALKTHSKYNYHIRHANMSIYLSNVYKALGEYKRSIDISKKAISVLMAHYGHDCHKVIWAQTHLSQAYISSGNYLDALKMLEHSVPIYEARYGKDHYITSWVRACLGWVYCSLGYYDKANEIALLVHSSYNHHYGTSHVKTALSANHLGNSYRKVRQYKKAEQAMQYGLKTYLAELDADNIEVGWSNYFLGLLYKDMGNYDRAIKYLDESLRIYLLNNKHNHVRVAKSIGGLGEVYFLKGDLPKAEKLTKKAIEIMIERNYPDRFCLLENFAKIKTAQSQLADVSKSAKAALLKEANLYLHQASEVLERNYPEDSPYRAAIKKKINSL